jgi:membrane protein
MTGAILRFGRDCGARFLAIQGLDRAMALAAQAFTALLPLLVVYGALVPIGEGQDFATRMIDRLHLSGASARSVKEAFASRSETAGSVTAIGVLLLVISALAFTRGLQRLFEGAYRQDKLGLRGTVYGLQWLGFAIVLLTLRPLLVSGLHGVVEAIAVLGLAVLLWLATPFLLLGRRLEWQRLVAGSLLTTAGMTALGIGSEIWLPRSITSLSKQFGFIGISFALVSWLFAAASVLVACAAIGAVIDERRQAPAATETERAPGPALTL